tara:strand:+ start:459 stop:1640 length:1182 start_codon:yes stop_codon:yes gene_type:complete
MSWEQVKIQDIFDVARGGSPRPIDSFITEDEDGVNWIMIGDTKGSGKYITKTAKKIKPEGVKKSREVKEGDFLLTNSMSFGRPYVLKTNGCIHDGWLVLRPVNDNIHTDYFYYYLGSNEIKLKLSSKAAGAVVKNLNKDIVKNIKVPLPPLDQQKKIAAILDAADAYRQKTKALITKYDELTQSLFLDMFGDIRINENKYLEEKLETACSYITDGAHRTPKLLDVGFPFMTVSNMKEYGYDFTNCKKISAEDYTDLVKNNCQPKVNDILFSKDGTVGKVLRIREHQDLVLLSSIAILRFKELYNPIYVEYYLKTDFFLFQATSRKSGSAIRRIVLKDLKKTKIALPPLELQNQFAERVQAIESQKAQAQASLAQAEDLFNSLLQRAFKGELIN